MSPGSTSASADLLSRRVGFCCRELQGVSTTLGELSWLYCESCEPWFEVTVMETKYLAAFWSLPYSCNCQTQRLVLKMTTAQVVETSVTVNNNSPIQNYTHPDDHTQPSYEMTPGFKPFTDLFFMKNVWNFYCFPAVFAHHFQKVVHWFNQDPKILYFSDLDGPFDFTPRKTCFFR